MFYDNCTDWDEALTLKRIELLKNIDNADELYEKITSLATDKCKNALFKKALHSLEDMSISWETFYDNYYDLTETILIITISSLRKMGSIEEIYEVYSNLPNQKVEDVFLQRAKQLGVRVTKTQMDELEPDKYIYKQQKEPKFSLFGFLGGVIGALTYPNEHEQSKYCDGDCANCPPHYGYRYGRWYYGHQHTGGCQRKGNG